MFVLRFVHDEKADGESFVSALYNKYDDNDEEPQAVKIYVPKSAPGCTSMWNMHLSCCTDRLELSSGTPALNTD